MVVRYPVFVPAYAKINLTLDVVGKREDGYHLLRSIMQTIALHDTIALSPRDDERLEFSCDEPSLETPHNLALRAADLLRTASTTSGGMTIELSKSTPAQAGLGGGSSDAASVLAAANRLWRLALTDQALSEHAATLGSDVPFFLAGGTALVEGRGELIQPLPDAEPLWLVLAKPSIGLSTQRVFAALRREEWSDGGHTQAVVEHIAQGLPLPFDSLFNALEAGVLRDVPEVAEARAALIAAGAPVVRMSGSGPTVFAPFRRLADAARVAGRAQGGRLSLWLTRAVTRDECARAIRAL